MANYTARQRLLTAMRREQPDRVPIHVRGVPAWNPKWVDSRHESYTPLIQAVRKVRYGGVVGSQLWSIYHKCRSTR